MMLEGIAFWFFSTLLIAAALMVIASRNPVYSVLFLIMAFFNAAALFVILGAEFLGLLMIFVYIGAVVVLFLFVVMMLNIDFSELKRGALRYLPLGVLVGVVLAFELAYVDELVYGPREARALPRATPPHMTNTQAFGHLLYTHYVWYFETAGMILLVAMIGAIVLTLRHRVGVKRQSIARQIAREPALAVELKNVRPEEPVEP